MKIRIPVILAMAVALAGCGGDGRDITLRDVVDTTPGPDEFSVLPNKPLQAPPNYQDLPTPTPGKANLVDATPLADGVAAFGGKPSRLENTGVPAGDRALVAHASRKGVPANIRQDLAQSDEDFRRRKSRFTKIRLARTDRYNEVYQRQTLDANREWRRYRATGVRTPSAPPAN